MGILNVTPDSFSDGGHFFDLDTALHHVEEMIEAGADIIDVGAESSRPGAMPVSESEEEKRLTPVLKALESRFDVPVSLDTMKSKIAGLGHAYGVTYINDISAGTFDEKMFAQIGKCGLKLMMMHMQGRPQTMQEKPVYKNVVSEVYEFFKERILAARASGVSEIVVDPGIGFGKTLTHNLLLLKQLDSFQSLEVPILLGTSRKSFINAITPAAADERLGGSIASIVLGLEKGATYFRVHDVRQSVQALKIAQSILEV